MCVEIFFHGGLCSMHKSAKQVNIGRNSEMENPIGPHFITRGRKKAAVTPPICSSNIEIICI
jgi:hypothetical protein